MTREEATAAVRSAILRVAPDADLDSLAPDAPYREALDLDSLDFLGIVELLSERTGVRLDEDDYPKLATVDSAATLLAERRPAHRG
ncbi:acyl carrier protein [Phaeacidiphilus oryzae]|uniref:acyl carrier protein n=1 Tax=Phaeacidiphilus oryzae TaxID=348818 RepID=UPI00056B4B2D|nr:acyl carrier protein [Phaeacidiphilus oryzae]